MKILNFLAIGMMAAMVACTGKSADNAATEATEAAETATEAVEKCPKAAKVAAGEVIEVKANTDSLCATTMPVVIDFNAEWCGPCQRLKPIFHEVAKEYAGKVMFLSVNVDSCNALASRYNVSSIPQVTFIKPDGTTASSVGFMEADQLKALIKENLGE